MGLFGVLLFSFSYARRRSISCFFYSFELLLISQKDKCVFYLVFIELFTLPKNLSKYKVKLHSVGVSLPPPLKQPWLCYASPPTTVLRACIQKFCNANTFICIVNYNKDKSRTRSRIHERKTTNQRIKDG